MATGDKADMVARVKALLPNGWFTDETPILDGVLNGIGWALAFIYSLISYARQQTRIATATDGFLDLISFDFFGTTLPRGQQESDASFRKRIQAHLFLERGTRRGLIRALELLTGRTPQIFEPALPTDTGGYNTNSMGYGVAGRWGSLRLPYQCFVTAYRPGNSGIPGVGGYGSPVGGYGARSRLKWASLTEIQGAVTDEDIYKLIASVTEEGTTAWTRISN